MLSKFGLDGRPKLGFGDDNKLLHKKPLPLSGFWGQHIDTCFLLFCFSLAFLSLLLLFSSFPLGKEREKKMNIYPSVCSISLANNPPAPPLWRK